MNYLSMIRRYPISYLWLASIIALCLVFLPSDFEMLQAQCNPVEDVLIPTEIVEEGFFGGVVEIEGNIAAVSHNYSDGQVGFNEGKVSVFRFDGSSWLLEQELVPNDWQFGSSFGNQIRISKEVIAVSDYYAATSSSISGGAVYIFRFNGSQWIQEQKIIPSDFLVRLDFGVSLAMEDGRLLVGSASPSSFGPGVELNGKVYFYHFNGQQWVERQALTAPSPSNLDLFGNFLAMHDKNLVVSFKPIGSSPTHRFLIYRLEDSTWVYETELDYSVSSAVNISKHLAVRNDTVATFFSTTSSPGSSQIVDRILIHKRLNGVWDQHQVINDPLPSSGSSRFFGPLAMFGDVLVVGAPEHAITGSVGALVFKSNGTDYDFLQAIPAGVSVGGLNLSRDTSIGISESKLILGTPGDSATVLAGGHARIVTLPCLLNNFKRGDANSDGIVELTDASLLLEYAFLSPGIELCEDAMDIDDNGAINLTDVIRLLGYLFSNGQQPSAPFQSCGIDANADSLSCISFADCP